MSDDAIKNDSVYYVSIEFTEVFIPSVPCKSLKITRSYDSILYKENVEILIDGKENELSSTIGNEFFINDFILNKDIAKFFFFDSERIVSLADTNTLEEKRKLSSAYNEVLGVKKYEDLKKNLESLRLRFRKKTSDIDNRNKLNALIEKQKAITQRIEEKETELRETEENLPKLQLENEKYQIQLLREGNNTSLDELKRQESLLETTKAKDTEYKQKLKTFLDYAPFAITGKLLVDTKKQLDSDYSASKSVAFAQNQNTLIDEIEKYLEQSILQIISNEQERIETIKKIRQLKSKYGQKETASKQLTNISKADYQEFMSVFNNIITTYKIEFEHLTDDYKKNKQVLERVSRKIANMHSNENDAVIKNIRAKKTEIENQINALEIKIRSLYEAKGELGKELATTNKLVSELSKKVSVDDSDSQKDKLAEQLVTELDTFLSNLKSDKKNSLEQRIKNTLNALMHKVDFIGSVKVRITDDCTDIDLYSPQGNAIAKESLSKGEQQLYATSILKALVDESGIEFPVFIDSPLQKFDKSHSNKIITEFYPGISKQVILFPLLHKELTASEFEIMKPAVCAAYLIKNENGRSFFKNVKPEKLLEE